MIDQKPAAACCTHAYGNMLNAITCYCSTECKLHGTGFARILIRFNCKHNESCWLLFAGHAAHHNWARILYAPNTTTVQQLMEGFAQQAACPRDPTALTHGSSFYQYFKAQDSLPACQLQPQCFSSSQCYQHVIDHHLLGFASEDEAVDYASEHPRRVDAALIFGTADPSAPQFDYTIRMNHTHMPSSRQLLNPFDVLPDDQYRRYWFFANLQQLVEQAFISTATGNSSIPHPVSAKFKQFPWPAVTIDLGAAASSIAFNLLLVYSFLAPTRSTVASIVREKELRLREGMRILGLQVSSASMICLKARAASSIIIMSVLPQRERLHTRRDTTVYSKPEGIDLFRFFLPMIIPRPYF